MGSWASSIVERVPPCRYCKYVHAVLCVVGALPREAHDAPGKTVALWTAGGCARAGIVSPGLTVAGPAIHPAFRRFGSTRQDSRYRLPSFRGVSPTGSLGTGVIASSPLSIITLAWPVHAEPRSVLPRGVWRRRRGYHLQGNSRCTTVGVVWLFANRSQAVTTWEASCPSTSPPARDKTPRASGSESPLAPINSIEIPTVPLFPSRCTTS